LRGGPARFWPREPNGKREWHSEFRTLQYRATELSLRKLPQTTFKLWGNGSVGSQFLTGIPVLERLRREFRREIAVWPFERKPARIVLAEVWPSLWDDSLEDHAVKDARQVITVARKLCGIRLPEDLPPIARTEGWILRP
jgi:hypothetical protein